MKRHLVSLLSLLLVAVLVTGCWSRREIENLGFATVVAIDKSESAAEEVELSVQFAITAALGGSEQGGGGGGGSEAPVWTVSSKGRTLACAIEEMSSFVGKFPFWAHTRVIILGEELARSGIGPTLDYFIRNRHFRYSTYVMVSQGSAKELLEVSPKLSLLPAELLAELNRMTQETSNSVSRTLIDLMQSLVENQASELILPLLTAHEAPIADEASPSEEQKGESAAETESLQFVGLAVFQGDKMIGTLTPDESKGVLWLRGESNRSNVVVEVPGGGFVVQRQIYGRRVLRITQEDGKPKAKIIIFQDGDLVEHAIDQLELNPTAIDELDNLLSNHIQTVAEDALRKVQTELKTDVLGIGERIYRLYPQLYNNLDWQKYFPTMPIEVEVKASFRRTGELLQSPLSKYPSR